MKSEITFSKKYLDIIKSLLKVYNDLDKKQALFFKKNENVYISAMSRNTLVHVRTKEKNINFEPDEIGILNLNNFLNYANAIEYGDNDKAKILMIDEVSTKGKPVSSFLFDSKHNSYRVVTADARNFRERKDRIIPITSNKDPLKKVAKFYLSAEDIKLLVKDVQLMNKVENFLVSVIDPKIIFYMKGIERQQSSRIFEGENVKIFDNYTTIDYKNENQLKIFKTKIIDYMSYFGCDFEVEFRWVAKGDILAWKARGVIPKSKENPNSIYVFVGTQENSTEVYGNNIDIVE